MQDGDVSRVATELARPSLRPVLQHELTPPPQCCPPEIAQTPHRPREHGWQIQFPGNPPWRLHRRFATSTLGGPSWLPVRQFDEDRCKMNGASSTDLPPLAPSNGRGVWSNCGAGKAGGGGQLGLHKLLDTAPGQAPLLQRELSAPLRCAPERGHPSDPQDLSKSNPR